MARSKNNEPADHVAAAEKLIEFTAEHARLEVELETLNRNLVNAREKIDEATEVLAGSVIGQDVPDERVFQVLDKAIVVSGGHDGSVETVADVKVVPLEGCGLVRTEL